jgi:RNAse (barnase) inhibitor barstar
MAWHVALVLDEKFSVQALSALVHQMPIWAVNTAERQEAAWQIRKEAAQMWAPDPAFTLFKTGGALGAEAICRDILWTVIEHHPSLATLDLIGVSSSPELSVVLDEAGFTPANTPEHLRFRKELDKMESVRELVLDATNWETSDDVYNSFFKAVDAPVWHGRNFNALHDSIITGSINKIDLPYRIIIQHSPKMDCEAFKPTMQFVELIREFESKGYPIEIHLG